MRRAKAALTLLVASATPAVAEAPFLSLPLDCQPGKSCYIEDYVDTQPGPGQRDYACGIRSRDGHKGTDFALTFDAITVSDTTVLAAAPGQVEAVRDTMPDRMFTADMADQIAGRECGNAVRIRHDNGLQTLYCHMRQGSVAVKPGDQVARGTVLGLVGLSGETNHPHLHLSVLQNGQAIDPFSVNADGVCTDDPAETLWLAPLPYDPTGFFTAGFSDAVPDFEDVKSGSARRKTISAAMPIVLYSHFYYAQPGDILQMYTTGPQGEIFAQEVALDDPQVQMFRAYGRKAPTGGWEAGTYLGIAKLIRDGNVLGMRRTQMSVD